MQPGLGATVLLSRVFATNNVSAGVRVRGGQPGVFASLTQSRFEGNGIGVFAGPGSRLSLYDSVAANNGSGIVAEVDANGGLAEVNLEVVSVSNNDIGVRASAEAGSAVVRMSNVLATNNSTSSTARSGKGAILSFGNNRLDVESTIALSSETPSQEVVAGGNVTYPVQAVVHGLLTNPVTFTCTGLPAGASCTFDPTSLPLETGTATIDVEVTTTGPKTAMNESRGGSSFPLVPFSTAAVFALPIFAAFGARRRLRGPLLGLSLLCFSATAACSSSEDIATSQDDADASLDPGSDDAGGTDAGGTPTRAPARPRQGPIRSS